jgi:uncharacterized protein with HEPN domain
MSARDWRGRIEDILEAIGNLQEYVEGMSREKFAADKKTARAAAYDVGVIGEAARTIPPDVRARWPEVPWEKMQAIRNVVVHEYFRVDVDILWHTITGDLPPLVPFLRSMLERDG